MSTAAIEGATESPEETAALGGHLAGMLEPGSVLLLLGDLGSGKTTLVSGIARALGAPETVTSPTFALCHLYESDPPLAHVDCWRLVDPAELADLALEEFLDDGGIAVVEWGEIARGRLGAAELVVNLTSPPDGPLTRRLVRIEADDAAWSDRLDRLRRVFEPSVTDGKGGR